MMIMPTPPWNANGNCQSPRNVLRRQREHAKPGERQNYDMVTNTRTASGETALVRKSRQARVAATNVDTFTAALASSEKMNRHLCGTEDKVLLQVEGHRLKP
ncbi:unnamed protein product [Heligmosomoides polygyrus]|uniref:Uncharacterized protein n=1 Tax=Heligmosomoides polygyrus TaxID=6339 RepID=A0A183FYU5_HELPZ|nr:unnamed protein product [Heligmosomoides polygyrus]